MSTRLYVTANGMDLMNKGNEYCSSGSSAILSIFSSPPLPPLQCTFKTIGVRAGGGGGLQTLEWDKAVIFSSKS